MNSFDIRKFQGYETFREKISESNSNMRGTIIAQKLVQACETYVCKYTMRRWPALFEKGRANTPRVEHVGTTVGRCHMFSNILI